ncbi:MAG: uracil phosphoribosyltransferase [Thermoflexibacter sp.]|jgi:uracil phosphoribosyltransferase|nr:uracil phosphoribosyltransferase [Thermoflexibacter sp.]
MFVLTNQNSIANQFLAELRDKEIQKDRARFRRNLERIGEILAYEISKSLSYTSTNIQTPLGLAPTHLPNQDPVLVCIMRAGLPFYQGFLNIFDKSESAFIGAFRGKPHADHQFDIEMHYAAMPDLTDKPLIIIDPMLATGKSVVSSLNTLLKNHKPATIHIASVIGSREGVNYLQSQIPNAHLWIGAIDAELNYKYYIIPGLGDAGDLAFGEKI